MDTYFSGINYLRNPNPYPQEIVGLQAQLMIIKKMDSKQEEIAELTALLKGRLTSNQRFVIERELKAIRVGFRVRRILPTTSTFTLGIQKTGCHTRSKA